MLTIQPKRCLMDEKIRIEVQNLSSTEKITIRCEVIENKFTYESFAHYIASLDGKVDLLIDPSFGGSYVGIDQMGIFWSMLPAEGQKHGLRYLPKNLTEAQLYDLQVYKGHLTKEQFKRSNLAPGNPEKVETPILEDTILRCCCGPGVTRTEVRYKNIRGTIFKPPGKGPFKGIIDVYGSAGGINETRVALLASHGYVAFTLPFFRYQDLPKELLDVKMEYFLDSIDFFDSLEYVLPGLGIVGLSTGGDLVLFLSTICPKLTSVISIGSSFYLSVGHLSYQNKPYPPLDMNIFNSPEGPVAVDKRGGLLYDGHIYDGSIDHLTFPIEKSNAQFLLIGGMDDNLRFDITEKKLRERMEKHGKACQIRSICYPGAGHFIDPPYMPQTLVHYNPGYKLVFSVGGEPVENGSACVHAWRQILHFLDKNTGKGVVKSKI